jgi:hypothetical protein
MKPTLFTRWHSATVGMMALLGAKFGMSMAATNWLVRTSGNDANGGTSQSVLATGTNGVTVVPANTLVDATASAFTAGMVGQGINIIISASNNLRTITGYTSASTITYSGGDLGANTGLTWTVGGSWLTVRNALVNTNSVAAGDSIYVGAGVYRTTLAVTKSGTSGNVVSLIGDVDGAKTSDAGQVTCTAFTTNDTTAPSGTTLLALAATQYLAFSLITFISGTAIMVSTTAASTGHDYSFTDCIFNLLPCSAASAIEFNPNNAGAAMNVTIDRCTVWIGNAGIGIEFILYTTASGIADWDAHCVIRNSLILSHASSQTIQVQGNGASTFKGGGVRVYNCIILAATTAMNVGATTNVSTTIPCEIHNSTIVAPTGLTANTSGQLTESYNLIYATTARTNVTAGTGSISNGSYAPLMELGQFTKWTGSGGVSSGLYRPMFAPDGPTSPLLNFGSGGSGGNYPTVDFLNRPRPSGPGPTWSGDNNAVGAYELHDFASQDTGTVPSGQTSAGKIVGPGDQYIQVPVDATATVITIQIEQGAGYGGTNYATATLLANGELGVAGQVETCSSSTGSFQTLTFGSITPTKRGWVTIQITSYDTSGTADVWFGAVT